MNAMFMVTKGNYLIRFGWNANTYGQYGV